MSSTWFMNCGRSESTWCRRSSNTRTCMNARSSTTCGGARSPGKSTRSRKRTKTPQMEVRDVVGRSRRREEPSHDNTTNMLPCMHAPTPCEVQRHSINRMNEGRQRYSSLVSARRADAGGRAGASIHPPAFSNARSPTPLTFHAATAPPLVTTARRRSRLASLRRRRPFLLPSTFSEQSDYMLHATKEAGARPRQRVSK